VLVDDYAPVTDRVAAEDDERPLEVAFVILGVTRHPRADHDRRAGPGDVREEADHPTGRARVDAVVPVGFGVCDVEAAAVAGKRWFRYTGHA
jgi:hypothetical protein